MNELLQMVMRFNAAHCERNAFAQFNYTGSTNGVYVIVHQTGEDRFQDSTQVEEIYSQCCYLTETYGEQETIEALTEHFRQWVTEFEREKAA